MESRRTFLKRMLTWWSMTAMPVALSACAGYGIPERNKELIAGVDRFSLREIADQKLHHGDGGYLNLFGGPMHGNPWRPAAVQSVNTSHAGVYNYSYVPNYKDQQTVPVTIDWNALKHDSGLSVTFFRGFREIGSEYEIDLAIINLGAYTSGSNPNLDAAIKLRPHLLEFLRQTPEPRWGDPSGPRLAARLQTEPPLAWCPFPA